MNEPSQAIGRVPAVARAQRPLPALLLATLLLSVTTASPASSSEVNYLSLARGTIPVAIDEPAESLRIGPDLALRIIDGNQNGFTLTARPGAATTSIALTFQLAAPTRFHRFDIPNVLETPSPYQTFFRSVEIEGSAASADGPFHRLANGELERHEAPGQATTLDSQDRRPVRWLRLRLSGGLDVQRDQTFFEFSELIGYGDQEPVALLEAFNSKWGGRGVRLELKQDGHRVTGCYDRDGSLSGTVQGNLLSATGTTRGSGTQSIFLLTVDDEGRLFGVRSSNGAPFRLYTGEADPALITDCSDVEVELPGCNTTLHGIQFDFDSDVIRSESEPLLDDLYAGLEDSRASMISLIGHSSSEGDESYNAELSQRRAESIAEALIQRGLAADRIRAQGAGESNPIADNETDAGRALNRRVEIDCAD